MTENRFISLAPDDPDDSDTDTEPTEPCITERPHDDVSAASDGTVYFDAWEADDDTPYFQQGAELPPREEWEIAAPIDFSDFQGILQISHQLDALFLSEKEIETPLGMDDTQQNWKWADVGSRQMPRSPLTYPTLMVDDENGIRRPAVSQVHHKTLFQWIVDNLSWLSQYDTVYVFVDNRALSGTNPPEYWPYLAPWIKGRCEVIGPYQEKTTAIHIPINSDTGLHQVHYTWAGAAVLEALCLVYPTVNFALADSDCVPTSLFEIAELVNLMTDKASRAEAMQHHTMASSSQCPPAVLLMTEAKAELNAGLIIVTGHAPTHTGDVDMDQGTPDASMPPAEAAGSDASDARAPKARRIVHPANNKSADEWVTALCNSRANFLATTAVPEDPAEAIRGGLVLTPLLGCKAKTPLDWTHAWAMLGEWAGIIAFPIPAQGEWPRPGTFFLHNIWMFGCTKPTSEVTAVAQTPPCRYHLGLGIYNVQTAVEGMDGNKRSHLLHLCGQLLRLVLIPYHVDGEPYQWTRTTAISFAAEMDGHVFCTLCAVTMALLTNRLDMHSRTLWCR